MKETIAVLRKYTVLKGGHNEEIPLKNILRIQSICKVSANGMTISDHLQIIKKNGDSEMASWITFKKQQKPKQRKHANTNRRTNKA